MGTWNYRLVEYDVTEPGYIEICEVYYSKKNKPDGWFKASAPNGETVAEIAQDLKWMELAMKKPILKESELNK